MTSLDPRDLRDPQGAVKGGLRRDGQPWTEAEDMALLTKGPVYGIGAVAERMGRTAKGGYQRHQKLTKER